MRYKATKDLVGPVSKRLRFKKDKYYQGKVRSDVLTIVNEIKQINSSRFFNIPLNKKHPFEPFLIPGRLLPEAWHRLTDVFKYRKL